MGRAHWVDRRRRDVLHGFALDLVPYWAGIPIMDSHPGGSSRFLLFTMFGSATAGLALGLLQMLPERHKDHWAFLVHRPVTRTTIFLGKALAGVCLYLLALGIPVAFSVLWVATPGHMAAPFYVPMAYPGLADVLCGLAYYFTALLIVTREARWFGSRGLSLSIPTVASALVCSRPHFWLALLAVLVAVATTAIAAWGTFASRGNDSSLPILARGIVGAGLLSESAWSGWLVIVLTVSGSYVGNPVLAIRIGQGRADHSSHSTNQRFSSHQHHRCAR